MDDDCLDVTETSIPICYTANDQQRCYEVDGGFDGDGTPWSTRATGAGKSFDAVGSGYNGTILAYGQTGSGKTHDARGGISVSKGITPVAAVAALRIAKTERRDADVFFELRADLL